jgi:acyl transferase domain-containing protein
LLLEGSAQKCSTLPPLTRHFPEFQSRASPLSGQGGWLGEEGVEQFDPAFFGIPLPEASTLRPNVRLGLELTYEALQNAGIPPSSLRGKRVSVSIGVGTEDGWDMTRWFVDSDAAFDVNWAASSDPSGISGRISHAFDFRGPCNTVSSACASGALALRAGAHRSYPLSGKNLTRI